MTAEKARLNVYILQQLKDRPDRLSEKNRRSLRVTVEILLTDALEALEAKEDGSSGFFVKVV